MSADSTRLKRSSDFTRTLDKGVRVSARDLLVSVAPLAARWPDPRNVRPDVAAFGGPRLGLIVSKKFGDAVTRHAVARRLRHAFAGSRDALGTSEAYVVVRARPSSAHRTSTELEHQLRRAFENPKVTGALAAAAEPDGAVAP